MWSRIDTSRKENTQSDTITERRRCSLVGFSGEGIVKTMVTELKRDSLELSKNKPF